MSARASRQLELEHATPRELGFAMPAEWEPHAGTWLAWPHYTKDWPGKFSPVPWIYADMVRLIAGTADGGEHVWMFVEPGQSVAVADILERVGANMRNITLIPQQTDRPWVRDSGPIFVCKGRGKSAETAILDWKFNAWAKYDNAANDDKLPAFVARRLAMKSWEPMGRNKLGEYQRFVLEGGSIEVNGAGCVLTTEECLLSKVQERNPGIARGEVEETLCNYLGAEKVLWLGRGVAGDDDTHGHIDDTARFVSASTIVACVETRKRDANFAATRDNLKRLAKMRDAKGKQFDIVELPMPLPAYFAAQRLPASYANFYLCNAGVLVPVFNDPADVRALNLLAACFPKKAVIPVYCRDLVLGLGALHCLTQQQPA